MKAPDVIITGLPGSGTTWAARMFQELNFSLGEPLLSRNERKGLEWKPFVDLKLEIDGVLFEHAYKTSYHHPAYVHPKVVEWVQRWYGPRLRALDCPQVIKCPGLGLAGRVMLPVLAPRWVILMHRPLDAWSFSANAEAAGGALGEAPAARSDLYASGAVVVGMTIDVLVESHIPFVVLPFPDCTRDLGVVLRVLAPVLHSLSGVQPPSSLVMDALTRVTRPEWVGQTARDVVSLVVDDILVPELPKSDDAYEIAKDLAVYSDTIELVLLRQEVSRKMLAELDMHRSRWSIRLEGYYASGGVGCPLAFMGTTSCHLRPALVPRCKQCLLVRNVTAEKPTDA